MIVFICMYEDGTPVFLTPEQQADKTIPAYTNRRIAENQQQFVENNWKKKVIIKEVRLEL